MSRGRAMRLRCNITTERERATIRSATRNANWPVRVPVRTGRAPLVSLEGGWGVAATRARGGEFALRRHGRSAVGSSGRGQNAPMPQRSNREIRPAKLALFSYNITRCPRSGGVTASTFVGSHLLRTAARPSRCFVVTRCSRGCSRLVRS